MTSRGKLLLIGTPIGNLGDLTPRAIEALRSCDLLLCEDTRHTGKLLTHFGISIRTESFHEHNESEKVARVLALIEEGKIVGLASDAGMPLLSDPGFPLLQALRSRDITVEPLPGPFAGAVALAASGLPPIPFAFFGFTPHREAERLDFYRRILEQRMTTVVYESPYRLLDSLRDALAVLGDVQMTLAREMTKLHETFTHGSISDVLAAISGEPVRGEVTLVFAATTIAISAVDAATLRAEFNRLRDNGMRRADAVKTLAEKHGLRKPDLYRQLLDEPEE